MQGSEDPEIEVCRSLGFDSDSGESMLVKAPVGL